MSSLVAGNVKQFNLSLTISLLPSISVHTTGHSHACASNKFKGYPSEKEVDRITPPD